MLKKEFYAKTKMKTSSDEEKNHIIEIKKHMKIFTANKQSVFAHR